MIAPMFANSVEIKTLNQDQQPAELVILRFNYTEGMKGPDGKIRPMTWPVASIFIPRVSAKAFMRQFFALMSKEDEYGGPGGMKSENRK